MKFIRPTFFILSSLLLILFVFSCFKNDISIEAITKESNSDFKSETYTERTPVYLISYADGPEVFYRNQNALVRSALNKGIDHFINYRKSHIDSTFYHNHKNILTKKRGAGYWLWKPYIILKTLKEMPENAVLIYSDTGIYLKKSMKTLIDLAKKHDIILIEYESAPYGTVRTVANHQILKKMNCDSERCKNSPHIWAGFSVYRNTPRARQFVKKWLAYCTDESIIFGILGTEPQDPGYKIHADDQTVLSVLHAKHSGEVYRFQKKDLMDLIIWHHRHPDKINIPIRFINYFRELRRFQRKMLNQPDS